MSYQGQNGAAQALPQSDPVGDAVGAVLKVALWIIAVVIALPLVLPVVAMAFLGGIATTKVRYWSTPRWWWIIGAAGAVAVVALLGVEAGVLAGWISGGHAAAFFDHPKVVWAGALWPAFWPWVIVNFFAGLLLVPAAFSLQRRRVARQVQQRRIPDVMTQERIEQARKHAADLVTARQMGVRVNPRTGAIIGRSQGGMSAPHQRGVTHAFGLVTRPTIRTFQDRFYDSRLVRDWIDPTGRFVLMPSSASAVRALLIAESGTGKTVLLEDLIFCALKMDWPIFMIDAKGDPSDAMALVDRARAAGRTAEAAGKWNLFGGTAEQITEKLMRLLPPPDGANQHYLDEVRSVLSMVQAHSPIRSADELRERLADPAPHVRDSYDLNVVMAVVDSRSGQTAAQRAYHALATALRPLESWLSADGWTYDHPKADVTVMPLLPVDSTQARLGDLLLTDLRHFMSTRLARGDKSPVLVIVDEFPQLITAETDPGDQASSLFETARSAGMGLVLAAQSAAGISNDDTRRRRALSSGAALIIGRSKDPEDVVKYAGTAMRMEASGAALGEELRSARAQHSYVIPPNDVREAWDGSFWLVQGGGIAPFRAMPPARRLDNVPTAPPATAEPATVVASTPPARLLPAPGPVVTVPAVPASAPSAAAQSVAALCPSAEELPAFTSLEIVMNEDEPGSWTAMAYPATDGMVYDDVPQPPRRSWSTQARPPLVPTGEWVDYWHPTHFKHWGNAAHYLPPEWVQALDELTEEACGRYDL